MKNNPILVILLAILLLSALPATTNAYTTTYNGTTYYSTQPYNLDIFYFAATDVTLDPNYNSRVSALMLWLQDYYKTWMINNGRGQRTFGLWTDQAQPTFVRIILVNGAHNLDFYRSSTPGGNDSLRNEVADFRAANPTLVTSEHFLVLTATSGVPNMTGLPYYGIGRTCYATDYPELDLQYIGQGGTVGNDFVTYFGGLAHELGHGLNLPHSHQTASENSNPQYGESLMAAGNYTLTASPTFINFAGTAILNNCQLFATGTDTIFYNGHVAGITSLNSTVIGNLLIVSGRIQSNKPVTDINFYQDPGASPTQGYVRVAFNTQPVNVAQDSFYVVMDANEVLQNSSVYPPTGPYNLEIEIVLSNGETSQEIFPFSYNNSIPVPPADFNLYSCDANPLNWQLTDIGATPIFPGRDCWNAASSSLALSSWGNGFANGVDEVTFYNLPITGDDTITARVTQSPGDYNNLTGLMIRSDLTAHANYVCISSLDNRGVFDIWRDAPGGNLNYNTVTTFPLPMWLRLVRSGNTIYSWYSDDNVNWNLYSTKTQTLNTVAYFGLVTSGNGARGVLDNITISNYFLTNIQNNELTNALIVYPNPAENILNLQFASSHSGKVNLSLKDISGKILISQNNECAAGENNFQMNTSAIAAGIYLLEVISENGLVRVEKVVIEGK